MPDKTRMFLEIDADQISVKQILQKEFLELSMKAVSSANPNRNNSWFTKESMEASIESFVNKPILGYFDKGDFVAHNGDWRRDTETGLDYWDTLGREGERILGTIRESDQRTITLEPDGLYWIKFTCILWTQYSYKQVKRLLKDAKAAKRAGSPTKNISVEVDLIDYEILPNGVTKINKFNLVGVTILGTRNGRKVEPGIENAELSVIDVMGRDVYEQQNSALRLAYEKLDNSTYERKEERPLELENTVKTMEDEVCPDCGKNPCECVKKPEEECKLATEDECKLAKEGCEDSEDHCKLEDDKKEDECKLAEGEGCGEEGDEDDEDPKEDECKLAEDGCDKKPEEECKYDSGLEEPQRDPVRDIAWLISDCSWNIASLDESIKYYSEAEFEHKDYVVSVLNRIKDRQLNSEKELAELMARLTEGVTEEDEFYEEKLSK